MMKKKRIAAVLAVWLCFFSSFSFAGVEPVKWNDANDHNRWTEWMLFGNPNYTGWKPEKIKKQVELLEDALLVCLDQYNSKYQDKMANLHSEIPDIPENIDCINFTAGNFHQETGHRAFTHRGWNHMYIKPEIDKSHPEIRKQILIYAVGHVFVFEKHMPSDQSEKVCDAMCCLMYNLHIIQDRYHSQVWYGAAGMLPLADRGSGTETVIHDLLECIPVLFPEQKKMNESGYKELVSGLNRIEESILSGYRNAGADANDELLRIDRRYCEELRDLLAKHLPGLMQKQKWFEAVFPDEWNSDIY